MKKLVYILAVIMAGILSLAVIPTAYSQNSEKETRTVVGTVYDEEGITLIGVAVQCSANRAAVVTDLDGNYSIKVPAKGNVSLVYSYLGMEEKKVVVTPSQQRVDITMKSDSELEAAVVNAGYGVIQNRETLTGSAFEVKGEDLRLRPSDRLDNLLAGQVPGLNVIEDNVSGRPTVKIRIRGDGSLSASCEPLWVIDGVPVYTGNKSNNMVGTYSTGVSPLSYMNTDDIESMTVLKDASTTALYGADGANGVILVTTKSAAAGQTRYNASVKYGITNVDRSTMVKLCNGEQWRALAEEGWAASGRSLDIFPYRDNEYNSYSTTDTDWFEHYFRTGQSTEVNFSASTGTKKLENFFSLGFFQKEYPTGGNDQTRYSIRNKSKLKFTDNFDADINLNVNYSQDNIFSVSSSYLEVIPIFEPYNADGSYRLANYYSTSDTEYKEVKKNFVYNEVPEMHENDNHQNTLTANGSITLSWRPVKGLVLTSQSGANFIDIYDAQYTSMKTRSGISDSGKNGSSRRSGVFDTVLNQIFRANYNRTFKNKFAVSAMAGTELTDKIHTNLYASGYGFLNDSIKEIAYADATTLKGYSNWSETRSLSYFAFGEFTYDNRYSVTASWRRQGNSAFSTYSRWDNFWSVGGIWNVHREKFFDVPWINHLSFKGSYGCNGNSRIDTSSSYGSYAIQTGNYYGGSTGANQSSPANPGLSWEKTWITNVGAILGLFNRVNLTVEYYNRLTTDVLYEGRVSSVITDGGVMRNVGEIENHGLEFTIDADIIKGGDFSWDLTLNGYRNHNIIKKLYKGMHTGFFDYIWVEGASKDALWLVRWAGVDPVTGAPMWYDKNGDLTYSFNYDDRVLLPQYSKEAVVQGGLTNVFKYRNWSLNMMMDYGIGGWTYDSTLCDDGNDIITENATIDELDHWTTVGEPAANIRFRYDNEGLTYYNSTRCIINKTYVQLRSLSLGYSLPKTVTKKLGLSSAVVSLVGDNLYLWTPGQYQDRNSYKNIKYSMGMNRGLSIKLNVNF